MHWRLILYAKPVRVSPHAGVHLAASMAEASSIQK